MCNKNPLEDYFLNINDLSINSLITLKWLKWGFFFYTEMIKELKKLDEDIEINKLTNNSINKISFEKKENILIIDDNIINNNNDLNILIEKFYNPIIFSENTQIHIKLKLNINEFLIINNLFYPNLCMYESSIIYK